MLVGAELNDFTDFQKEKENKIKRRHVLNKTMVNIKLCDQDKKKEFQQLQPKNVATPTSPLTVSIIISQ